MVKNLLLHLGFYIKKMWPLTEHFLRQIQFVYKFCVFVKYFLYNMKCFYIEQFFSIFLSLSSNSLFVCRSNCLFLVVLFCCFTVSLFSCLSVCRRFMNSFSLFFSLKMSSSLEEMNPARDKRYVIDSETHLLTNNIHTTFFKVVLLDGNSQSVARV